MRLSRRLPSPTGVGLSNALKALSIMAVSTCLAPIGGCAAPSEPTTSSSSSDTLAIVRRSGGLCSTGPCAVELVVHSDGRWTFRDAGEKTTSGSLAATELLELSELVANSGQLRIVGTADAARCAANYDGPRTHYTLGTQPETVIDTCTTAIQPSDPLIESLDNLLEKAGRK